MARAEPKPPAGARPRRRRAASAAPLGAPTIRPARRADLAQVVAIDATVTGVEKEAYWHGLFRRYGTRGQGQRHFLVALVDGRVAGFVIGEVRDWEFGQPPCGWVFAIDVDPRVRQAGVGTWLLAAVSERFAAAGVRKLRTLLASDNTLILSFFRSQGMMAGSLIPLEMDLPAEDVRP